jgi:hypothetical protein
MSYIRVRGAGKRVKNQFFRKVCVDAFIRKWRPNNFLTWNCTTDSDLNFVKTILM